MKTFKIHTQPDETLSLLESKSKRSLMTRLIDSINVLYRIATLCVVISLYGCHEPEQPVYVPYVNYMPENFSIPGNYLGLYESKTGIVCISDSLIVVNTKYFSKQFEVNNSMFYNNCYIKIPSAPGKTIKIWKYSPEDDFIRLEFEDSGVEYDFGFYYLVCNK